VILRHPSLTDTERFFGSRRQRHVLRWSEVLGNLRRRAPRSEGGNRADGSGRNGGIARIEGVDEPVEWILGGIWDTFFIGGPWRRSPLNPNCRVLLRIVRALLACNNFGDGEY
jgi:hypothetical protein